MIVTGVIVAVAVLGGADRQTVLVEGDSVSRDSAISTQSVAFEHSRAGDRARPMMQPSDPPLATDFIPVVESDGTKFSM